MIQKLATAWYWWRDTALQAAGLVYRGMMRIARAISNVFWKMVGGLVDAFSWLAQKTVKMGGILGIVDTVDAANMAMALEQMGKNVRNYAQTIEDVYNEQIAGSLDNSEERTRDYYAAIEKLNDSYNRKAMGWADMRQQIVAADAAMGLKALGLGAGAGAGGKSPSAVLDAMSGVGIAPQMAATAAGGVSMSTGSFREVSLRRISLAQSAPTRQQKQQVSDETVAGKLEDIKALLGNRRAATAVLG
jgi:hypothetical protein